MSDEKSKKSPPRAEAGKKPEKERGAAPKPAKVPESLVAKIVERGRQMGF